MRARLLHLLQLVGVMLLLLVTAQSALAQNPDADNTLIAADWQFANLSVEPTQPTVGDVAIIRFRVHDHNGFPVEDLRVIGKLRAPVTNYGGEAPDPIITSVGRAEERAGAYMVAVALNQAGRWWVDITVTDPDGQGATMSQFLVVAPTLGTPPATTDSPLFLRGDSWGAYYRLDPNTGSIATLAGQDVLHANGHWWVARTRLEALGPVTTDYGGTWQLTVELSDGLTGKLVHRIDIGAIRASVYVGSSDQPAIATSLALAPDGSRLYVYWARQLGQGWLGHVTVASTETGELLLHRELTGAIVADIFWGQLDVTADGSLLVLAEQAVRSADVSGYRLTVLQSEALDLHAQHRRTVAPDDPLTACALAYPGPTGAVGGTDTIQRYSLCSPTGQPNQPALIVWDPVDGTVLHQIDLHALADEAPYYVNGIASPDGQHFYAVNTATRHIIEIDMHSGTILREQDLAPAPEADPSSLNRFFNWIFGVVAPQAEAGVLLDPGVSIAPDGRELYLVAMSGSSGQSTGDGVLVIDTESLNVVDHLLAGQPVAGLVVTPSGQLVVREVRDAQRDELSILDPSGQTLVSLSIPGRQGRLGDTH